MVRPHNFKKCSCKQHFHSKLSLRCHVCNAKRKKIKKDQYMDCIIDPLVAKIKPHQWDLLKDKDNNEHYEQYIKSIMDTIIGQIKPHEWDIVKGLQQEQQ